MTAAPARVADTLAGIRIVPVVVIDDADKAPDLVAALAEGGIRTAEITLRTPAGLDAIRRVADTPGFVVGAGTVVSPEDVDRVHEAGAQYIVSPGFDDEVVARAHELGLAALPGIATATELQRAVRAGLDVVKFFPADRLGGLGTITALAAPFPDVRFVPSGGVSAANAAEYLASPPVLAVSGSWMAPRTLIAAGDFVRIRALSAEASS